MPSTDRFLDRLASSIGAHVRPGVGLIDPRLGGPSPSDHYGHTSAALALACAPSPDWTVGRQAMQAWLALDGARIDHLPFNHLLLLLLRELHGGMPPADLALLEQAIRRCQVQRRYRSNNWTLLAATCELIEARDADRPLHARRICELLDRWTTPKGGFIDFPAEPHDRFCTPLAYHHKALFLTALGCWFQDDPALAAQARRLLDWLVHCWDPAGYAGGYGRSTHSLFGDACLVASLVLVGADDGRHADPIDRVLSRLEHQRRPDGFYWLTPSGPQTGAASWDEYMYLSVYNAWAAAVVGAARKLRELRPKPGCLTDVCWQEPQPGLFHDERAGLAAWRTSDGTTAVVSTRGQPPQIAGRNTVDLRHAGGNIVHLSTRSTGPAVSAPILVPREALLRAPQLAGWTPVFSDGDTLYVLGEFSSVQVDQTCAGFTVTLSGQPTPVPAPASRSLWHRLMQLAIRHLPSNLRGRRAQEAPAVDTHVRARLSMAVEATPLQVQLDLTLDVAAGCRLTYLNPRGSRTMPCASIPRTGRLHDQWSSLPDSLVAGDPPERLKEGQHHWTVRMTLAEGARPEQH